MIIRLIFILIFSLTCFGNEVVPTYGKDPIVILGKKLTPFWAQEYSGIDLVRSEMKDMSDLSRVSVSIFDTGFESRFINTGNLEFVDLAYNGRRRVLGHHGTSVANLINGEIPFGSSDQVDYISLNRVVPNFRYSSIIKQMIQENTLPQIISNSMGWTDKSIADVAHLADSKGSIWVLAGGYQSDNEIRSYEDQAPVINVASYSPSGIMSMSARDFKEIDIFSPADLFQASIDGKGQFTLFGESSGATPLVSGTIANLLSIEEALNREDIEVLLKRSSLPSLNQYIESKSKAGLLNSYKMFKVLTRLKSKCRKVECIKKGLRESSSYEFSISTDNRDYIKAAFQRCSTYKKEIFVDPKYALLELRKNILLNHQDIELLKIAKCVYTNEGFSKNSEFYHHLILLQTNVSKRITELESGAIESIKIGNSELSYLRHADLYSNRFKVELLKEISTSVDTYFLEELYTSLYEAAQ
jgi:hypothetical protein